MAHLLVVPTMQRQTNGPLAPLVPLILDGIHVGPFKINNSDMVPQLLGQLSILFTGKIQCIDLNRMGLDEFRIRIANTIWIYATIVGDHAVISITGTQDPVYLQLCRAVMNPVYNEFIQLNHDSPKLHIGSLSEHNSDLATRLDMLILPPV